MADRGVDEDVLGMPKKAEELKEQFQKLAKDIIAADDIDLEAIDRAQRLLYDLKELKYNELRSVKARTYSHATAPGAVPEEFKCPLSKEIMSDPVVIASGQTFEKSYVQKWIKSGKRTCPLTQQVLAHPFITPNNLIQGMVKQWCKDWDVQLPESLPSTDGDEVITEAEKNRVLSLIGKMSSTLLDQHEAAKELRHLTKAMPWIRSLFNEYLESVPKLITPLLENENLSKDKPDLLEDVITVLFNISIQDNNKKLVAETPQVIPLLIGALKSGSVLTKSNAAAALFTLAALNSNKILIGESGALKVLIDLLEEEHHLLVLKDAASAIFCLCIAEGNRPKAVEAGAVRVVFDKISNKILVDELISILALLSSVPQAVQEMGLIGAVPCLLGLMREASCSKNQENCVAILHAICQNDRSFWPDIWDEENKHCTISQLALHGTSRAKRKASALLGRLKKFTNLNLSL